MSSQIQKKVVVVGDGGCGKTCLLYAFTKDEFPEWCAPTIFDTHAADIEVENQIVKLILSDTAGDETYDRLRPLSYPEVDVMLICHGADDPDSIANVIQKWYPEVKHYCPDVPIVLTTTKMDLRNDKEVAKMLHERPIHFTTTEQARAVAKEIGAYGIAECSAKTRECVHDVFLMATKAALSYKTNKKSKCDIL